MQEIFLARQPILDRNQHLVAFELLFRARDEGSADVTDDTSATASVIAHAWGELGIQRVLGRHKGFINLNAEILMSDMIGLLPSEQVVLELLETVNIDQAVIERCRELKRMGFGLALDDVTGFDEHIRPLLEVVDVVKVDLHHVRQWELPKVVEALRPWPVQLLAEKIDSLEQAERCMALGFDLFQGYYFAHPQILTTRRADPSRLALLRLFSLILGDADELQIEQELKRHANLSYNLIRMVNAAASGLAQPVDSLREGIVRLGRRQLQRWTELLLYTAVDVDIASPLMQMAATRGKLMEYLAEADHPSDTAYHDQAFMAGIMSLLDTLLGIPMPDIVGEMNLADAVQDALLHRGGRLGLLLTLAEKLEDNDEAAVVRLLKEIPGIDLGSLTRAELAALEWANRMGEANA